MTHPQTFSAHIELLETANSRRQRKLDYILKPLEMAPKSDTKKGKNLISCIVPKPVSTNTSKNVLVGISASTVIDDTKHPILDPMRVVRGGSQC
jgi:hypothetical protein